MLFRCKVCDEKDKRISALESEISFLRNLAHPPVKNGIAVVDLEADGVLSGSNEQIQIQSHEFYDREEQERILAERDALLNGTYE